MRYSSINKGPGEIISSLNSDNISEFYALLSREEQNNNEEGYKGVMSLNLGEYYIMDREGEMISRKELEELGIGLPGMIDERGELIQDRDYPDVIMYGAEDKSDPGRKIRTPEVFNNVKEEIKANLNNGYLLKESEIVGNFPGSSEEERLIIKTSENDQAGENDLEIIPPTDEFARSLLGRKSLR